MPNPYHDDPKLTAYVLGELTSAETAQVERLLAESAEARAAVEQIRAVTSVLSEHLPAEPMPALTPTQKETIMSEPNRSESNRAEPRKSQPAGEKPNRSAVMAACCLMLAAVGAVMIFNETGKQEKTSLRNEQARKGDAKRAVALRDEKKTDRSELANAKKAWEANLQKSANSHSGPQRQGQQGKQSQSSAIVGKGQPRPGESGGRPSSKSRGKGGQRGVYFNSNRNPAPRVGAYLRPAERAKEAETMLRKYERNISVRRNLALGEKQVNRPNFRTTLALMYDPQKRFDAGGRVRTEALFKRGQARPFGFPATDSRLSRGWAYKEKLGRSNTYSFQPPGQRMRELDRLSQLATTPGGSRKKTSSSPQRDARFQNVDGTPKRPTLNPGDRRSGKHKDAKKTEKPDDGKTDAKGDPTKKQPTVELYQPKEVKAVREHFVKRFKQLAKAHPKREIAIMRVKERIDARLKGIEQQVAMLKRAGRAVPAVEGRVIVNEVVRTEVKGLDVDGDGRADFGGEEYESIVENKFLTPLANPLSTLSIDVDTASFSNTRRFIEGGLLPPKDAVRIEELVNYFRYDYTPPKSSSKDPFSVTLEMNACPWNPKHKLVMIGLKGRELPHDKRPAANLVFLIDVSGSMSSTKKLPLVKLALEMLVNEMQPKDRISIVTYSNSAKVALEPTPGHKKAEILRVIHSLNAAGGTNGDAGIQMAYAQAQKNFFKAKDGANRVILCTDGDFNIGIKDPNKLIEFVRGKANKGVFLSVFGFGMGNYKGDRLEKLSNKGNGNYAYIDGFNEAKKVFVEEMAGTLFTIAKDVKIQVEFNPAKVASYRLIGYENRLLAAQDFNDDKKDAGEIGAGHTVTALYEIVPAAAKSKPAVDELKYQKRATADKSKPVTQEVLTVKLRYKQPDGDKSTKIEFPLKAPGPRAKGMAPSEDFDFASSVAMYGLLLRDSKYAGESSLELVRELAVGAMSKDPEGHRSDFVKLVHKTRSLVARKLGKPVPAPRAFEAGKIQGK